MTPESPQIFKDLPEPHNYHLKGTNYEGRWWELSEDEIYKTEVGSKMAF
ncbi:MAG: hypothetical protein NVSMB46_03350 [Candidatus Saccharimonadales bacterium]